MNRTAILVGVLAASLFAAVPEIPAQNPPPASTPARRVPSVEEILGDPVVARGKGFEIKRSRLDEAMAKYRSHMIEQGTEVPESQMAEAEAGLLDYLIQTAALNLQATDAQKARGRDEAEKRYASAKKVLVNDDAFIRRMRAMGTTPDIFHERLLEDSIRNAVLHDRFHVPDEDLKKYYDEHPTEFMDADKARVVHILLTTVDLKLNRPVTEEQRNVKRQRIDALLKRARAGEDFAKLARENSEDSAVKEDGGEIKIIRGSRGIPREFEAAAFTLQTNQVSDVITSTLGFHLIKMLERIPGKKTEFSATTNELRNFLEEREFEKGKIKFMVDLKKQFDVEILDPELRQLDANLKSLSFSSDLGTNAPGKPAR
jgi:foldase protein PrsA